MKQHEYFKVVKDRQDYFGVKYFRQTFNSDTVLQVCVSPATELRRGRSNNIGIFFIDRNTFVMNYYAYSYVTPCTKKEFMKQFEKMVETLRPRE